jgi:hypothetical protein
MKLTTNDIAERTNMSWQTAKKYLDQMYEDGLLRKGKKGSTIYWWIKV